MTPKQVFSFKICESFKNTFFCRTPPVTASGLTETSEVWFYFFSIVDKFASCRNDRAFRLYAKWSYDKGSLSKDDAADPV